MPTPTAEPAGPTPRALATATDLIAAARAIAGLDADDLAAYRFPARLGGITAELRSVLDKVHEATGATPAPLLDSREPLTVLHTRGDDGGCDHTLWTAGEEYRGAWDVEDVDAGRGYDAEDWAARIAEAEALPPSNLREELVAVLADPPNAEHIAGWTDRHRGAGVAVEYRGGAADWVLREDDRARGLVLSEHDTEAQAVAALAARVAAETRGEL